MLQDGIIKLVFIGNDPRDVVSKMFPDVESALKVVGDSKDYLLMMLAWTDGKMYRWEVLDYGRGRLYLKMATIFANKDNSLSELNSFYEDLGQEVGGAVVLEDNKLHVYDEQYEDLLRQKNEVLSGFKNSSALIVILAIFLIAWGIKKKSKLTLWIGILSAIYFGFNMMSLRKFNQGGMVEEGSGGSGGEGVDSTGEGQDAG